MSLDDILEAMAGHWSGAEVITVDPAAGTTLSSTGQFETVAALGGAGSRSSYTQDMSGQPGMMCETVYQFGPDNAVTMVWVPNSGEAQIFTGQRKGAVITASRNADGGMTQTQVADYSTPDQLQSRMIMTIPNGPEMTVFEATYERKTVTSAQPSWHDLTVDNPAQSLAFYEAVFGGSPIPISMGDYNDYCLTNANGDVLGGLCHARGGNAGLPPVWLTYFPVPSLDDAISTAKASGGTLVSGPHKAGETRYAVLSDPSGAAFTVSEG